MSSPTQVSNRNAAESIAGMPERGTARGVIYSVLGFSLQKCIEWQVRLTGRRVSKAEAPWLDCVIGREGQIFTRSYCTTLRKTIMKQAIRKNAR